MGGPVVTIVFLAYNRRHELRESLQRMLTDIENGDLPTDVIVVDNASTDGTAGMVRREFPQVRLIERDENVGVSGWNDGFAAATGDWILALDDDCYLPPGGLEQALTAAKEHEADLVSFRVVSTRDPAHVFTDQYRTGLFTFWGCAVLMRRQVIDQLEGYDPEIFVWANELEFMLRFFDLGLRHLHLPEVAAQHMKSLEAGKAIGWPPYRVNASRFAYVAAKLLRRRDAIEALVAVLASVVRDGLRISPGAVTAIPAIIREFGHGLRHRQPVGNPSLSRFYRKNFVSFASPWWFSRRPIELIRRDPPTRWHQFFERRARFYPAQAQTLDFASPGTGPPGQVPDRD